MKKRKVNADIILISALLLLALGFFVFTRLNSEEGKEVVVKVNGVVVETFDLTKNGQYSLNGGTNILVIEDGKAYLIEADCPDKLCVKQGKIHSAGQTITCLPNKLVVEIVGGQAEVDF